MTAAAAIVCLFIVVLTFTAWEFVAWFTHKYVMHGFLWRWHKSHHSIQHRTLERNDLFVAVFSLPCVGIFYYFTQVSYNPYMLSAGAGIFSYGVFYVIFHDILVHQRIPWRLKKRSKYLRRMINAHHIHHSRHTREGCEAFGFLYAPRKYEEKDPGRKADRSKTP